MDTQTLGPHSLKASEAELDLSLDDVVVLMSCNDHFVPYASCTIQSLLEHANINRTYDLIILSSSLSQTDMDTLSRQVGARENADIDFLNPLVCFDAADDTARLDKEVLPFHGHFRSEMYFRLFAAELLPSVNKAVYIDSDLIVLDDIAKLFDTDLDGCLIGAAPDADTAGMAGGYDADIYGYLQEEVGLDNPFDYFQSGVIVINLELFRAICSIRDCTALIRSKHWQWPDQDMLNHLARGHYVRLDMKWNVLHDWQKLRRSHIIACAPCALRNDYEQARLEPRIIHYAGPDNRPWLYPHADYADIFWDYAARCPYYSELLRLLHASTHTVAGLAKRMQVFMLFRVGMPFVNFVCPPQTRRRRLVIQAFRALDKGRLL